MGTGRPSEWLSPDRFRWVELDALRRQQELSCIDGRHPGCTLGTPGGDAGELVLLSAVLEWYLGEPLDDRAIDALLALHASELGRFYLHSDDGAIAALADHLQTDVATVREWLVSPPPLRRGPLLDALLRPEHVGCGHLRTMLLDPTGYRVRRGLVKSVIRAFFERLWSGDAAMHFVVLGGEHDEEAMITFHSPQRIEPTTLVPTWCAADDGPQAFVRHLPALRYVRRLRIAHALASGIHPKLGALDETELLLEIERLGERHLELTLSRLQPGIPRYRVRFEGRDLEVVP